MESTLGFCGKTNDTDNGIKPGTLLFIGCSSEPNAFLFGVAKNSNVETSVKHFVKQIALVDVWNAVRRET